MKKFVKLNIQEPKIMATGPITIWQLHGETMERLTNFIGAGAPKSLQTVAAVMKLKDSCSLKKSYDKTGQHIKKSRDITLMTKVHLVQAMVFPVLMYGCESWTRKKAEH